MASIDVKSFVDSTIADNKVAIFSKSWCPYCKLAKKLFADSYKEEEPKIIEIDNMDDEQAIQDYLKEISGQRSVPNIYINQKHVGGNDKVQAAHKANKLVGLLSA